MPVEARIVLQAERFPSRSCQRWGRQDLLASGGSVNLSVYGDEVARAHRDAPRWREKNPTLAQPGRLTFRAASPEPPIMNNFSIGGIVSLAPAAHRAYHRQSLPLPRWERSGLEHPDVG